MLAISNLGYPNYFRNFKKIDFKKRLTKKIIVYNDFIEAVKILTPAILARSYMVTEAMT